MKITTVEVIGATNPRRMMLLLLWLSCLWLLTAAPVHGAEAILNADADLRADRFVDSPVLRRVASGSRVTVLRNESGWSEVKIDGKTGWLRAGVLGGAGAAVAPASRLETGRSSSGNVAMVAGIRGVPRPGSHALIVTIGDYQSASIPLLAGPEHDVAAAREIALAMGVPEGNIRVIRDHEALAARVQDELAAIADRLRSGDRVYVHLSAHGTRVAETTSGVCVDAWLSTDGKPIANREFATWLRPIADRADKLVVLLDVGRAMAAGAVASRGGIISRYVEPNARTDTACAASAPPAVASSDGLVEILGAAGVPAANLAVLRAAGPGQSSWEDPGSGGWATRAVADCLTGIAIDADQSGAITLAEGVRCAQGRLDAQLVAKQLPASRLDLTGNSQLVPVLMEHKQSAGATQIPGGPLAEMFAQRDARWRLEWQVAGGGGEFTALSAKSGFLYVLGFDLKSRRVTILLPAAGEPVLRMKAGTPRSITSESVANALRDPAFDHRAMLVVTDNERRGIADSANLFWLVQDDAFGAMMLR